MRLRNNWIMWQSKSTPHKQRKTFPQSALSLSRNSKSVSLPCSASSLNSCVSATFSFHSSTVILCLAFLIFNLSKASDIPAEREYRRLFLVPLYGVRLLYGRSSKSPREQYCFSSRCCSQRSAGSICHNSDNGGDSCRASDHGRGQRTESS